MKNPFKNVFTRSIKIRLVMMTVGIVISVVFLLTTIIARNSANLLEQESRRQLSQSLELGTEMLSGFLTVRKANLDLWRLNPLVEFVMDDPVLGSVFIPSLREYFSDIRHQEPWIENILLLKDNRLIYEDSETFKPSSKARGSVSQGQDLRK